MSSENVKLSSHHILDDWSENVEITSDNVDLGNQLDAGDKLPHPGASTPVVKHETVPLLTHTTSGTI